MKQKKLLRGESEIDQIQAKLPPPLVNSDRDITLDEHYSENLASHMLQDIQNLNSRFQQRNNSDIASPQKALHKNQKNFIQEDSQEKNNKQSQFQIRLKSVEKLKQNKNLQIDQYVHQNFDKIFNLPILDDNLLIDHRLISENLVLPTLQANKDHHPSQNNSLILQLKQRQKELENAKQIKSVAHKQKQPIQRPLLSEKPTIKVSTVEYGYQNFVEKSPLNLRTNLSRNTSTNKNIYDTGHKQPTQSNVSQIKQYLEGPLMSTISYEINKINNNIIHGQKSSLFQQNEKTKPNLFNKNSNFSDYKQRIRNFTKENSNEPILNAISSINEEQTNFTVAKNSSNNSIIQILQNAKHSQQNTQGSPTLAQAKNKSFKAKIRVQISNEIEQDELINSISTTNVLFLQKGESPNIYINKDALNKMQQAIIPEDTSYFGGQSNQQLQQQILQNKNMKNQFFRDTYTSRTANSKEGKRPTLRIQKKNQNDVEPIFQIKKQDQEIPHNFGSVKGSFLYDQVMSDQALSLIDKNFNQYNKNQNHIQRVQKTNSISYNKSELNKQFPSQQSKLLQRNDSFFTIQETSQRINSNKQINDQKIEELENEGEIVGFADLKKQYKASKHQMKQFSAQEKQLGLQSQEIGVTLSHKKQYNYVSQNIEGAQDYKNQKIRQNHQNIQILHDKLMKKKLFISSDSTMQAIQRCLPPKLRKIFGQNQEHAWLLNDMNNLNANFAQIIEMVCGYRIELGVSLQNLVECYNSIFLQQFEIFYSNKLEKEHELQQKIKQTENEIQNYGQKLQRLLGLEQVQKDTLETKNIEIKQLIENEQNLQNTIEILREIIQKSKKNDEKLENTLERKKKQTEQQGINMDVKIEKQKINSLNQELDTKAHLLFEDEHVSQLLLAVNRAELEQHTKQQYLQNIQKVLAKLMLNNSKNQSAQTQKSIWNEQKQYAYDYMGENGESFEEESGNINKKNVDLEDSDDSDVIEQRHQEKLNTKFNQIIAERQIFLEEEPNQPKKEVKILMEEINDSENQNSQFIQSFDKTIAIKQKKLGSKIFQNTAQYEQNFDKTEENSQQINNSNKQSQTFDKQAYPQLYYNKSLRQNGLKNENQLEFLHNSLDQICEQIKKQNQSEHQVRNDHLNKSLMWKIPFSIISFCTNRIKQLISQSEDILKWELYSWSKFKGIIYSIYEHRLKNSQEINGHSNMNYCTLNEYILIYFISIYKERSKAEEAIVDVIINLRYYYGHQSRAKMFSQNLECVFHKSSNILVQNTPETEDNQEPIYDEFGDLTLDFQSKPPQNIYDDKNCPENDLYAQEFFLHAFSLFIQQKINFVESAEGKTYIRMRDHNRYAKIVISLIRGPCGNIQKWNYKAQQMVKKIVFNDTEIEYLDVDEILYGLMNEFKNQKSAFQQSLEKEFMKKMDTFSAAAKVSFEQFENLVADIQMGGLADTKGDEARIDPLIKFTGTVSLVRAYIFCLNTSQTNTDQFSADNFIAGISRYGIENPTPPVSQRCQLYGNTFDIMDMLKEAEIKYGALKLKIHTKRYTLTKPRDDIDRFGQKGQKQSLIVDRRFLRKSIQHNESAEFEETQQQKPFVYEENFEKITDYQDEIAKEIISKKQASTSLIQTDQKHKITYESYLLTGGVKTQIQNIKNFRQEYEQELLENLMQKKIQMAKDSHGTNLQEIVGQEILSILGQSQTSADEISQATKQKKELTMIQYAMSHKQIMVPSLSTTSHVLQTHLKLLRDLQLKIDELKQAYQQQQDKGKSWHKVEQILSLLRNASLFLDIPSNYYLNQFKEYTKDNSVISLQNKEKSLKQSKLIKSIIKQRDDLKNQIVEVNSDEEEDSDQENKKQKQDDEYIQQEQKQEEKQQQSDEI